MLALLLLAAACTKAPQTQDAVKQAVLDHLGKRGDMLAQSMDIGIVSVNFRDNEAEAVVSVTPKEGGAGIQMRYQLAMDGANWVVKPPTGNPHGNAPMPSGGMPAGHPPVSGAGTPPPAAPSHP